MATAKSKTKTSKTRLTIHRALSELKILNDRILKQTRFLDPVGIHQKDKNIVNVNIPKKEFEEKAKADFQSLVDLLERKKNLKKAIVACNAKTMVSVAGKRMSVADAITFKSNIAFEKEVIDVLETRQRNVFGLLFTNNETVQKNLQALLEKSLGNTAAQKADKDAVENISKPFLDRNEYHLSDPLDIVKKIRELTEKVNAFEAEVDAVLSESNAVTFIDI